MTSTSELKILVNQSFFLGGSSKYSMSYLPHIWTTVHNFLFLQKRTWEAVFQELKEPFWTQVVCSCPPVFQELSLVQVFLTCNQKQYFPNLCRSHCFFLDYFYSSTVFLSNISTKQLHNLLFSILSTWLVVFIFRTLHLRISHLLNFTHV